jgi:hypothetical protein
MKVLPTFFDGAPSHLSAEVPASSEPGRAAPPAQGMPAGVPALSPYERQEAEQAAEQLHLSSDNTRRYALLQRFAHNLSVSPENTHPLRRQSLEIRYEHVADLLRNVIKTSRTLHDTVDRFAQAEKNYSATAQAVRGGGGWWTRLLPDAMVNKQLASRAEDVTRLERTVDAVAKQLDQQGREADKLLFAATSVRWLQHAIPQPPPDAGLKHIPFF